MLAGGLAVGRYAHLVLREEPVHRRRGRATRGARRAAGAFRGRRPTSSGRARLTSSTGTSRLVRRGPGRRPAGAQPAQPRVGPARVSSARVSSARASRRTDRDQADRGQVGVRRRRASPPSGSRPLRWARSLRRAWPFRWGLIGRGLSGRSARTARTAGRPERRPARVWRRARRPVRPAERYEGRAQVSPQGTASPRGAVNPQRVITPQGAADSLCAADPRSRARWMGQAPAGASGGQGGASRRRSTRDIGTGSQVVVGRLAGGSVAPRQGGPAEISGEALVVTLRPGVRPEPSGSAVAAERADHGDQRPRPRPRPRRVRPGEAA